MDLKHSHSFPLWFAYIYKLIYYKWTMQIMAWLWYDMNIILTLAWNHLRRWIAMRLNLHYYILILKYNCISFAANKSNKICEISILLEQWESLLTTILTFTRSSCEPSWFLSRPFCPILVLYASWRRRASRSLVLIALDVIVIGVGIMVLIPFLISGLSVFRCARFIAHTPHIFICWIYYVSQCV